MTNEDKLSKALQDFKMKYPNITSADLQTFIIGWQEAVKNCFIPDVSNSLIAYQKWCYAHPEYDQVCESSKVAIYIESDYDSNIESKESKCSTCIWFSSGKECPTCDTYSNYETEEMI